MRIIKEGSLPEEKEKRATCSHCGTIFEFKLKEAVRKDDQREGSWYEIKCPFPGCSRMVIAY